MKKTFKLITLILVLCTLISVIPISASASTVITDCVTLLNPRKSMSGSGYYWDNRDYVLTLTSVNIQTESDYGLKIPHGATVVLNGKNYIKASVAAVYIEGNVIFKGKGSLTVLGGDYGILCNSTKTSDKFSINSGKFDITGAQAGIRSDFSSISLSGGDIKITSKNGYSVSSRFFSTAAGVKINASGSIYASELIQIQGTNLEVSSSSSALISDGGIRLENMKIKAGPSPSSLSSVEGYNGEKAITTESTLDFSIKSIIFGENYSIALDIALLILTLLLLASLIFIPKLLKKKKLEKINARRAEAEEREKAEREAAKRERKKKK